jgi:hypothetical protein
MSEPYEALLAALLRQYGPLLGPEDLRHALAFQSRSALHQAVVRGAVPIRVFKLPSRNGRFALTHELAQWLADLSVPTPAPCPALGATGPPGKESG